MKNKPLPGRTGASSSGKHNAPKENKKLLLAGWIFLGLVILLAVGTVLYFVLPGKAGEAPAPGETAAAPVGIPQAVEPQPRTPSEEGGSRVSIRRVLCDFTEPTELSFGILTSPDLSSIAETLSANVKSHGWGNLDISCSSGGSSAEDTMVLRGTEAPRLTAADLEQQKAFLASDRPEAMARTFLEDSGLMGLLRPFGIELSTDAENDGGTVSFRGVGETPGSECTVTFSFLYTGSFNQARIRCTALTEVQTTTEVIPLSKAISRAVSWTDSGEEAADVTAVEIRSIRGIPFYVFTLENGASAYALAVKEEALAVLPEAQAVCEGMMRDGIRELVVIPGVE